MKYYDPTFYARLTEKQEFNEPEVGQIWLLKETVTFLDGSQDEIDFRKGRPHMVLLVNFDADFMANPHSVVQVFPVSTQWTNASPLDLAFNAGTSPIPRLPIMIQCWNPRKALSINLMQAIGKIPEKALEDVEYLRSCALRKQEPTQPLKSKGHTGLAFGYKDRRQRFQEREAIRTNFISDPADALKSNR